MTELKKIFILFLIIYFLIPNTGIRAQQLGRNLGAKYYLGSDDELLVPVNIWGFVQKPGQYMVPSNTDLISLISYAGGPKESAKINKIRIVRHRSEIKNKVLEVNVKKYLKTGNQEIIPILKPGDTIIIKGTTFSWIQNFFSFLASFAVFAQMFYFIAIAEDRLNN
ncbi:MAG: hypothetical protein R6V04_15080 [bacterium]